MIVIVPDHEDRLESPLRLRDLSGHEADVDPAVVGEEDSRDGGRQPDDATVLVSFLPAWH